MAHSDNDRRKIVTSGMALCGPALAVFVVLIAGTALANATGHHARGRHVPKKVGLQSGAARPTPYAETPSGIIDDATTRARQAPGLVTEIDPTAKETATGGPAGGIPLSGGGP